MGGIMDKATEDAIMRFIQEQVEEQVKTRSISVEIGGEHIDIDDIDYSDGEIRIKINPPIYYSKTGKTYQLVETESLNKALSGFHRMAV